MKYENTKLDQRLKKKFQFDYAKASLKKNSFVKKETRGKDAPKAADAGETQSGTDAPAEKA